jgi:CheY-like chemotaxis protein
MTPSTCCTADQLPLAQAPAVPVRVLRGTVLLVEDNEDNRLILEAMLTHAGYRVLLATSGDAGVALARSAEPDVVLMDIALPGLDGWEATRRLKGDPATRRIPVVALTAHAMTHDRERARALGFDGYLAKPIEPRDVLAAVERIVRGG